MALAKKMRVSPDVAVLVPPVDPNVKYPSDDGEPMAETKQQYEAITAAVFALELHLKGLDRVGTVRGDCALYYDPHKLTAYIAPDVLFAYDVQIPDDEGFAPWVHQKVPDLVMEMASPSTHTEDSGSKWHRYAELGIPEYWQYDPHQKYLDPLLQGWQLVAETYEPIRLVPDPVRGVLAGASVVLATEWGLDLMTGALHLWNPTESRWYPTDHEAEDERQREKARRIQAEDQVQRTVAAADTQRVMDRLDSLQRALALSELPPDLVERLEHYIAQAKAHQPAIAWDTIPDGIDLLNVIRRQGGPDRVSYATLQSLLPPLPPERG